MGLVARNISSLKLNLNMEKTMVIITDHSSVISEIKFHFYMF